MIGWLCLLLICLFVNSVVLLALFGVVFICSLVLKVCFVLFCLSVSGLYVGVLFALRSLRV